MNVSTLRKPAAILLAAGLLFFYNSLQGQVNSVIFGKNRIQYHKFNWRFYQTENFNVYFTQNGLELAKYVLQVAEQELPSLEAFTEIAMQRQANIILYNSYDDKQATNIGLGNTLQPEMPGQTQLVNNKMILYFNGDHADLRRQIREGIARILVDNRLFGDNIGEVAGNAALLDLPTWLTDGYVSYAAENWSAQWDDALRNALLSGRYNTFYSLAYDEPVLAGHAFWHYVETQYKKENVTYFLYLSILYKNTNTASQRIAKKKLKEVLKEFMAYESDLYYKDLRGRRAYPKGRIAVTEEVNKNTDFYHFVPNPNRRLFTWAYTEYKKGRYSVVLIQNYYNRKVLISDGVRVLKNQRNPNYPIMAWDGKGSRLAYTYWKEDKIWLEVFDIVANAKRAKVNMSEFFDQVQDMQYMLDPNTLIFSAVKNGHTDLFIYKIDKGTIDQLTDDVWDDMDASFVSFPNKYGIIFSSNRPDINAKGGDTSIPSKNRYNVFLIDAVKKGGFRQISQLSNLKYGNARYPTQYNVNHFTFVSDANGISNRYAGFFTTKAAGLDTLMIIGDEVLRNPDQKELDSTLRAWNRSEPDSIGYIAVTSDSTYTFPITNYQSSLLETRIAGDIGQVSEVTRQGDTKFLYQLRVDSLTLYRRNINPKPTPYVRGIQNQDRIAAGKATLYKRNDTAKTATNTFQSEFDNEKPDTAATNTRRPNAEAAVVTETELSRAKLFKYRLKFSADQVMAGVTNSTLITRYQPYNGGQGPIQLNNGNNISFALNATISDLMEDYRFTGGIKPGINLRDNEYFFAYENFRKRLDWGAVYYKSSQTGFFDTTYTVRQFTNLYQANIRYPFDVVRSLRLSVGYRQDRLVLVPADQFSLGVPDQLLKYAITRLEYVHDNSLNAAQNIWHGLRYKAYMDVIAQVNKYTGQKRQFTMNFGFDARHYLPLYRNLIWAVRAAGDVSWGNQKLIYYLGGTDGWISPKFNDANRPDNSQNYSYQTLAVNMRGYRQNLANGNNALVINSEFRVPVFATFFNKPINNAFLRNFQLTQFVDLGSAWVGTFKGIKRPTSIYQGTVPVTIEKRAGGIGPFAGGYGFGARSMLLGYFVKIDAAWPMDGIFKGKPIWYFSLGFDF